MTVSRRDHVSRESNQHLGSIIEFETPMHGACSMYFETGGKALQHGSLCFNCGSKIFNVGRDGGCVPRQENKQVQSKVGYGDTVKVLWGCTDPFSILSLPLSVSPLVHLLLLDACN